MIWWIVWTSRYSFTVTTLSRSDSSQESSEKPVFLFPLDFSVSHSPFAGSTDMGSEKLNCTFSSSAETELDSDGRSGGTRESGVASPRVRIAIMNESADNGPTTFTSERSKHQVMRCCGEPIIVSKPPLMWLNFIITTSTRRGGSPSYGSCTAVQFSMHCVVGSPGSAVVLRGGGVVPVVQQKDDHENADMTATHHGFGPSVVLKKKPGAGLPNDWCMFQVITRENMDR